MKKTPAQPHAVPIFLLCLLTFLSIFGLSQTASAVGNILDLNYSAPDGITGYGHTGFTTTAGRAVAIQPDGKIVVAGAYTKSAGDTDSAVLRYNLDGTPDTSFGTNGVFSWGGGFLDRANAVAIDTTDPASPKIIVVGTYNYGNGDTDIEVMRLNANGTFDKSFNGTGELVLQQSGVDSGNAVAVLTGGKIVVVGTAGNKAYVVRLNSNGSYDTGFNSTGSIAVTGNSGEACTGNAVAVQNDGKIVVTGSTSIGSGQTAMLALRFTTTGALDDTFGTNGEASFGSNGVHSGNAVAIDDIGRIVVVGTYDWSDDLSNTGKYKDIWVQRLNSNGTPDTANFFIDGGTGGVTFGGPGNDIGNGVAIQDGMIIVVGTYDNGNGTSSIWVHRLKDNGQPSTTFNNGQSDYKLPGTGKFTGNAVALQDDKKIVVAGTGYADASTSTILSMRLYGDAFPLTVTTLSGSGTVSVDKGVLTYDGTTGTEYYAPETVVTLVPVPSNGNVFASWGGACTGASAVSCQVTMSTAKEVTITFVRPTLTVSVVGEGSGSVTSSPAGISCMSGSCSSTFSSDVPVVLTAKPDWASIFAGWNVQCDDSSADQCTITMDLASKAVEAAFDPRTTIMQVTSNGTIFYSRLNNDFTANLVDPADSIDLFVQAVPFFEDYTYGYTQTMNFNGGQNETFDGQTGYTTINGVLKIKKGRINVNRLKVQPRGV